MSVCARAYTHMCVRVFSTVIKHYDPKPNLDGKEFYFNSQLPCHTLSLREVQAGTEAEGTRSAAY